ncbi:TLR9 protein-like [Scleropages formosus]|uniref:TLR9 protein-like n=1 Tax=Scleropages formosus TaxID=113540 RepID=A0A0P7VRG7_SCLFO|nr:TLR9 protein-like [Scleropages formosus]
MASWLEPPTCPQRICVQIPPPSKVFLWIGVLVLSLCNWLTMVSTRNPIFFPCENDTSSKVKSNAFSGIPNLQNLSMMWNCPPGKLKHLGTPPCHLDIDMDAFVTLKNLTHLFLAGNSLTLVPRLPDCLEVLGLEFNHIFRVMKPLGCPRLKQLLLFKNCYYDNPCNQTFFISETVFQDLPDLRNLSLGFNNITAVPRGLPPSLESLDLKENKISEIGSTEFASLKNLRHLNLEWNCQRCDHAAQPCFPCMNNSSIKLHPQAFQNQGQLTYLSLRGNSLRTLPDGLFQGLQSLTSLDLSDNLLAYSIRNGTFFKELKSVKTLNLIYNYEPLKTFRNLILSPHFSEMSSLEELLLSELPTDNIEFGDNFTTLDLSFNKIRWLPESFFKKAHSLRYLRLSHNELKFLDTQSFPFQLSGSLKELRLDGNPFMCSCDTSWFIDFLRTSPFTVPSITTGIRCGFPESQHGQMVLSMDPRSCQEIFGSLGFLFTSFMTVVFTLVPLLKKLYGWDLWYCLQVFWAGHKGYSQLRDGQGKHDAFVVFDTANAAVKDWVYHELTVNLEERGRQSFKSPMKS